MNKIIEVFGRKNCIVNKGLASLSDQFKKVPRFVMDYMIAKLVDENSPTDGIRKIDSIFKEHFFESDQKELIKSRIQKEGSYSLIGQIKLRFDQALNTYWCDIPVISDNHVRVTPELMDKYGDNFLKTDGIWGKMSIGYDPSFHIKRRIYPFVLHDFTPLQITNIGIEDFIKDREKFSKHEWIDLLINTIGFDPNKINNEEKWLHLCRLVPFIQPCVHMIELGPTETAKTFIYRNISPHGYVISGSATTAASLFYNKVRKSIGLIGNKDIVCFDEITTHNVKLDTEVVNMLKDALNSGKFSRDNIEFITDASICFVGNIDCDRNEKKISGFRTHILAGLPNNINKDRAFIDRINGIIPGWKFSKISNSILSNNYGFMMDYFAAIMHELRNRNYYHAIANKLKFYDMSYRNQNSIMNITCGLIKLIHPNAIKNNISKNDIMECVDLAISLRLMVLEELNKISPKEFPTTKLKVDYIEK